MPRDDIVVKSLPAVRVAWISHPAAGFGAKNLGAILAEGIPELAEILLAHDVEIVGQPFGYYEGDPDAGTLVAHVSLPIGDGPVDVPAPVEIVQLPAVPEAVSVVVPAPTGESYAAAYTELGRWIEAHDYEIAGHGRDVYLNTTRPESDADVLMEIQWPVRRTAG